MFPIEVPSLSERRDDIPILVEAFIAQFNRRMGKRVESIDAASLEYLRRRDWPGNVRELRHVIERAMILCEVSRLEVEPTRPMYESVPKPVNQFLPAPAPVSRRESPTGESQTLLDMEREHIRRALEQTNGVIEGPRGAAVILGLKPSTLRSRMKRLSLERAT